MLINLSLQLIAGGSKAAWHALPFWPRREACKPKPATAQLSGPPILSIADSWGPRSNFPFPLFLFLTLETKRKANCFLPMPSSAPSWQPRKTPTSTRQPPNASTPLPLTLSLPVEPQPRSRLTRARAVYPSCRSMHTTCPRSTEAENRRPPVQKPRPGTLAPPT